MKEKDYEINKHNSTVCGYPGRDFDWSKFDWEQKTEHDFGDMCYSTESEYIPQKLKGQLIGIQKAPAVFVDNFLIGENSQYLHVPYNYAEDATIFRVRPNESMRAGETYRGRLIKRQTAIKKEDGKWYWHLEFK